MRYPQTNNEIQGDTNVAVLHAVMNDNVYVGKNKTKGSSYLHNTAGY